MLRPPIRATLLFVCLFTAPALLAQVGNVQFGQSFPLTNTRYGEVSTSESMLLSNDNGTFLFWLADEGVRVTKLNAEPRNGRLALESLRPFDVDGRIFDVVWLNTHFLVAATSYDGAKYAIIGQLLSPDGEPVGGRFTLVDNGTTPALAATSSTILLVYASGRERARLLTLNGGPTGIDHVLSDATPARHDVASNGSGFAVVISGLGRRETTMLNRDGLITAQTATNANDTEIALASDGRDYLLVTTSHNATHAHLLRANGTYERTTTLAGGALAAPAIAWNHDHYVVAFVAAFPRELRVARVDREARGAFNEESRSLLVPSEPAIAVRSGRVHVAYGTSPVLISELPLATDEPDVATNAAIDQHLFAAVSSSSTTLVVWGEGALHTGIRHNDGRWRERVIEGVQGTHAVVESDGNGFLLIGLSAEDATRSVAIRMDASGEALPQRTQIPFKATDAVWTGAAYAVVGVTEEGVRALFIDGSGIASTPIVIENLDEPILAPIERAVLATDGQGFLVVWEEPLVADLFPPPVLSGWKIVATQLTETLERVGPSNILVASFGQWPAVAVRNGVYQMAWASGPKVFERSLHNNLLGPETVVFTGEHDQRDVQVTVHDDMSFVSWLDTFSDTDRGAMHRIQSDFVTTAFRTALPTAPLLVPMPGGEIGYLGAAMLPAAPHYGSTRITMALGDIITVPRVTTAPVATARVVNRSVVIEWNAPSPDVDGYRVEYRINDGPWTEIERWFDPNERSMSFGPIRSGVVYAFRVRAWSAGGTSPYSKEAVAFAGRRRAVR